ncbi:MAG: hypothetical protein HZB72_02900 [Burkholderiales bacterium]|nr:hypothetical protein [Burkholderiales bacterium]
MMLFLAATQAPAQTAPAAQSRPAWLDEVSLSIGAQRDRVDGDASLSDSDNNPPFATGDQHILRGHEAVPWLRLEARIAQRHGLRLGYQTFSQRASNPLRLGADYLGTTIYATGPLATRTEVTQADLSWRWWTPVGVHEFGAGLGVAFYKLDVDGSWVAVPELFPLLRLTWAQRFSEHTWAPELSFGWNWRPASGWRVFADASGAKRSSGDLTGEVLKLAVGAEWSTALSSSGGRIGLGAEYGWSHLEFERRAGPTLTTLDLTLHGPSVFVRLAY